MNKYAVMVEFIVQAQSEEEAYEKYWTQTHFSNKKLFDNYGVVDVTLLSQEND